MRVKFIGTGEAFDEKRNNTCILINEDFLIECGYSIPQILWKESIDKKIKYVFISHFHADHVGGLPAILMRMRQEKRKEALTLIGGNGFKTRFLKFFNMCYKGFFIDLPFKVKFIEVSPNQKLKLTDYGLNFEKGSHLKKPFSIENLAIKISKKGGRIVYSGDTIYTKNIVNLSKNCDLLIHEAYLPHHLGYHKKYHAHCSPLEAAKIAEESKTKSLAIVHIHRKYREKGEKEKILREVKSIFSGNVFLPNDGDEIKV